MTQFNARAGPIPYVPNDLQPAKRIATNPVTTSNAPTVNRPVSDFGCAIPVIGFVDELVFIRISLNSVDRTNAA
ncbi:MAG: hypothetical protein ACOVQH_02700, partial [Burkholderiaceae bacterium]